MADTSTETQPANITDMSSFDAIMQHYFRRKGDTRHKAVEITVKGEGFKGEEALTCVISYANCRREGDGKWIFIGYTTAAKPEERIHFSAVCDPEKLTGSRGTFQILPQK